MRDEGNADQMHDLEVSLWVGKGGVGTVADELAAQLEHHDLVKVKFLRAARTSQTTEELAIELADRAGGEVVRTRGHTAVFTG